MKITLFIASAFMVFAFAACNNSGGDNNNATPKADSTAAKKETKEERNKKIIMAGMEGINVHDAAKVMKDCAPGFVEYQDGSEPPVKGDSAKQMLQMYMNAFDIKSENPMYFADGNNVIVVSDWTMTFKGDFMGMKATNKSAKMKDVDMFTLDDNGKVLTHRSIYPAGAAMMQMGCDMSKMAEMEKKGGDKDMKKDMKKK